MDPESVTAEALRLEETVNVLHQEGVVDGRTQVDVADVARAVHHCHPACGTDGLVVEW